MNSGGAVARARAIRVTTLSRFKVLPRGRPLPLPGYPGGGRENEPIDQVSRSSAQESKHIRDYSRKLDDSNCNHGESVRKYDLYICRRYAEFSINGTNHGC